MARVQSVQSVQCSECDANTGRWRAGHVMVADSHREMRYFNVTTTNTADLTIAITRGT